MNPTVSHPEQLISAWQAIAGVVPRRKYALAFCDHRPLAPGERRMLHRKLPEEAQGLPVRALALLSDHDIECRPRALRVNGQEIDPWSATRPSSCWYAEAPGTLVFANGAEIALEVWNTKAHPARFSGALLLGDWSDRSAHPGSPATQTLDPYRSPCRNGGSCLTPQSGGACPGCGYPRAYAHPDSLLDAFGVNELYLQGTAVMVYPDPGVPPGIVQIVQCTGDESRYAIPPTEIAQEKMLDPAIWDRIVMNANPAQFHREGTSPFAALGVDTAANLLKASANLLGSTRPDRYTDLSPEELASALIEGVASLMNNNASHATSKQADKIRQQIQQRADTRPIQNAARTMFRELERAQRLQSLRHSAAGLLLVDDRRPRVNFLCEGPFPRPISRIRIALLPGELDHIQIYDLQIGTQDNYPLGTSVIDRVPGYDPGLVREGGPPVRLKDRITCRYLPGSVFAGQLRDGVAFDPEDPYALRTSDLLGGVWIDLPVPLPSLGYAYLVYGVDPGHALIAAIEPA